METIAATYTSARPSHQVSSTCDLCGAVVADWMYETDRNTNEKVLLPRINHERHTAFHERLGF